MSARSKLSKTLDDKAACRALADVYGKDDAKLQAGRHSRLAALLAEDLATDGGSRTARGGVFRHYSAPGRTELGGNHTDHNDGRVLCAAVDLDAIACVAPKPGLEARLVSDGYPEPILVDLSDLEPRVEERGRPEALVRGVARGLADRGTAVTGFSARLNSKVLPGSGLSSSAAIEVLLGTIMADLAGSALTPLAIARIGQYAENEYFGKPCGLMDQTASAVGGIVSIDFADPSSPRIKRLSFDFEAAGYCLVVVGTGGSHADLTAEYAAIPAEMRAVAAFFGFSTLRQVDPALVVARGPEIRAACGDRALLRAFHFFDENARVPAMVDALKAGTLDTYFKLVKKSGDSSWRLLQNLSPPGASSEQGLCLALALSADFIGKRGAWRVQGGGFAGTIQAYLPRKLLAKYTDLMERYFGSGCVMPVAVRPVGAVRLSLEGR